MHEVLGNGRAVGLCEPGVLSDMIYAQYNDTFIADVTFVSNDADGWVTVKDKNGKVWNLTAFGSKAVRKGKKKYALYIRQSEQFTFYHLR
jgi:hypothetical protein